MKQSAQKENDQNVTYGNGRATAATAERYVDIVDEPGVERYVPTAPELGYVA